MNKIGPPSVPQKNCSPTAGVDVVCSTLRKNGDGKTMTKSLPSASILGREDICATAKRPGLVIPFSQHACGHGLLNIPEHPT